MAEHLSGYQPEYLYEEGLPCADNDIGGIEEAYQLLAPDEIEQMRQAAAAVAANMRTGQQEPILSPPDEAIPTWFVEADQDEAASPMWTVEPLDEQVYPDEALMQSQREHARRYYLTLIAMTHQRYCQEETLPEPQELIEAYAAYIELTERENQNLPSGERLPSFTLPHLWAAARRYNAWVTRWVQEQCAYEAPEEFEEGLLIMFGVENGLAQVVQKQQQASRQPHL
jgi:hypothetical protein